MAEILLVIFSTSLILTELSQGVNVTKPQAIRDKKALSIFNIVRFQNGPCISNTMRNGTCYTAAECTNRAGSASGTCAAGYGVCCVFSLGCGGTSVEACTFLTRAPNTMVPSPCTYRICKCSESICRIRLDFQMFMLAQPGVNTVNNIDLTQALGPTLGDCLVENFVVTSPGGVSPPVICGFNAGQHMIVDASPECHTIAFNVPQDSQSTWDIKVSQLECGAPMAGPDGCLQYFTGTMGTVGSFNFPTNPMNVPLGATHLSNQCYSICFRQEQGACAICFTPVVSGAKAGKQDSFGLSNPGKNGVNSLTGNACIDDFLRLPGAQGKGGKIVKAIFKIGPLKAQVNVVDKLCGRIFAANNVEKKNGAFVCTQLAPFRLDFKTDANEVVDPAQRNNIQLNELAKLPGGIVGFHLKWNQIPC